MAYCDHEDVEARTGFTYSASSQPSRSDVTEMCEHISLEIDSALRAAEYALPITDTAALALLKHYAKLGAAYQAWYAGVDQDSPPAHVESWKEDYQAFLKRVAAGTQVLPGLGPAATAGGWSSVSVKREDGFALRAQGGEYSR